MNLSFHFTAVAASARFTLFKFSLFYKRVWEFEFELNLMNDAPCWTCMHTHNFFLCLLLLANAWWCCTLFTLKHEIIMVNVFTFYYFFSSFSRFPLNYSASDKNFFVCKKNQLNYAKESPPFMIVPQIHLCI